jgi:hypothetical protein
MNSKPGDADSRRAAMSEALGDDISPEDRAAFDELFGERAEPYWLDTPGDFIVGTVEEVGEFASEFGTVPQLVMTYERGKSMKTPEIVKGGRYVVRLFGKALAGRKAPEKGNRVAIGNRGTVTNKKGTYDYTDLELKILS